MAGAILLFGLPLYEGLVASRSRMIQIAPNITPADTTNKYMMARSAHVASETLTSIRVVFSNFYNHGNIGDVLATADTGLGASTTITASVEYPAGTFTQLLFVASASGTIPDVGTLFSDYAGVSIPSGATFWVRSFWHNANGTLYNSWQNTFFGEATALSPTAISDQTMGGTISNSGPFSYPPLAIVGMTHNASVIIIGDSITAGQNGQEDTNPAIASGFNGKVGTIAPSLGNIPFLILAVSGEKAITWVANAAARDSVVQKGSHLVCGMGINDIDTGSTAAQLITALRINLYPLARVGQKIFQTTLTPQATSTAGNGNPGAYESLADQTPAHATVLQSFNASVRGILAGTVGTYDICGVFESSFNSGVWLVTPTPPYTGDGTHPNVNGYPLIPPSGVVSPVIWP